MIIERVESNRLERSESSVRIETLGREQLHADGGGLERSESSVRIETSSQALAMADPGMVRTIGILSED